MTTILCAGLILALAQILILRTKVTTLEEQTGTLFNLCVQNAESSMKLAETNVKLALYLEALKGAQ